MPSEIIIREQKFYNQLKNGVGFTLNGSDVVNNLACSLGERIKVITQLSVVSHAITTPQPWNQSYPSPCVFSYNNTDFSLIRNYGSFIDDGISVGDTVDIIYMNPSNGVYNYYYSAEVSIISETKIIFKAQPTGALNGDFGYIPDLQTGSYPLMEVFVTSWLTSLIFKFGLIENDEPYNSTSKVSLSEQAFYGEGIGADDGMGGRLTTDVNLTWLGNDNSGKTGSCKAAWVSTTNETQVYNITHEFIVTPFFLKEWGQIITDDSIPELYNAGSSIKYAIYPEFRTVLSNPNTSKRMMSDLVLGCVGYYDQNFAGFNNIYTVDSIVYTDSATAALCDGLQVTAKTKAVITISKVGGFKNTGENFGVMVTYAPDDTTEYQNTATTLEENFLFDNAINAEAAASVAGANGIITYCKAEIKSTELEITVEFEYTVAQQLQLQNLPKYIIGVLVSSDKTDTPALVNIPAGNADKVMLLADYTNYVYNSDIEDLMGLDTFEITRHDNITGTQFTLWNEDGINANFNFWLDTALSAVLNSLDFALVAYKDSDDTYFVLDQIGLGVAGSPIVSGIQQLNLNTNRGYKLATTDIQNQILLTTGSLVSTKQYYNLSIGQKIKWQDWIQNIFADNDFFDITKTNDNLNYKSSNYGSIQSPAAGYSIRLMLIANVQGVNPFGVTGNTIYNLISPEQFIYDYNSPDLWLGIIETWDKTGTTLLGTGTGAPILYDDYTLLRTTWICATTIYPYYSIWNIHRIEESEEGGDAIYEHSTLTDRISTAPFTEVTGATTLRVKQTFNLPTNTVVAESLIDYNKLDLNKKYKLSARISYDKLIVTSDAKITEDGIVKITDAGEIKIIES
jgi:hypothetical protein